MAKNHATVKTNFNNEIESNNLYSNFDKNEERETLLQYEASLKNIIEKCAASLTSGT